MVQHLRPTLFCLRSSLFHLFAQIVSIRSKRAQGKKLDKAEQEFYRRNRALVDLKQRYTQADEDLLKQWLPG